MLLYKIINTNNIDLNNPNTKELCNFCIKNKYIKIAKYEKMILITLKLQKSMPI